MLRRCGVAATSTAGTVPALLWLQRRGLFGGWGKNATTGSSGGSSGSSGMPKLPMPFDLNKLRQMRDVLAKMPAERQKEIMDEFVALQKSTDKSEGLMQRVQKSAQLFEQLLQQAEQNNNNSSSSNSNNVTTTSTTATAATTTTSRGPTLEQLRKIDLGSELEALFAELARMRAKKNEYRSKLAAAEAAAEQRVAELTRLRAAEADLRARLHRAEHQAMLLTSENVELSERAKLAKELTTSLHTTRLQLRQLQQQQQEAQADNGDSGGTLRQQLQSKDAALRSLQRKLDRMRRRDPLLQFSLACSDVRRLCNAIASHRSSSTSSSSGAADDATTSAAATAATTNTAYASASTSACDEDGDAEVAFARLRSAYEAQQRAAWTAAAHADAAAARAYVAVLRACVRAVVPYAHYDAAVTVVGDADAARACIAEAGFVVLDDADSDGGEGDGLHTSTTTHANNNNNKTTTTLCVCARDDAAPLHQQPGPYGYLAALQMAMPANMHASPTRAGNNNNNNNNNSNSSASSEKADDELLSGLGFAVVHVRPRVSSTLLRNRARSVVTYETARASGPGGQATNVSETQVYARLAIDGAFAYHAEAQDSRSALSNRQAALTRLQTSRRVQYNDTLARQQRVEDVYAQLVRAIAQHGGLTPHNDVLACVRDARESGALSCLDVGLVRCMTRLAAAAERATTTAATRPTASNDDARDAAE